jgi:hypothetical protein
MQFDEWWKEYKRQEELEQFVRMLVPLEECARSAWNAAWIASKKDSKS